MLKGVLSLPEVASIANDPQQTLGGTPHPYPNRPVQKTLQMR